MTKSQKFICQRTIKLLAPFQNIQNHGMCKQKKPCDMISPADPISNLHHIKYAAPENETPLERKLREHRENLQEFNKAFWTKHNSNFIQKKRNFEKCELSKKDSENQHLSADEISVFYKQFLDEHWSTHLRYLLKWYRSNFYITFLHLRVKVEQLFKKR